MAAILLPGGRPVARSHAPRPATGAAWQGGQRGTGIVVVIAVHALMGWALASGLARQAIDVVRKPIEASLIPEAPVQPAPPPPKVEKLKPVRQPKEPPPPAYVPPPEQAPAVQTAPTIVAVQSAQPVPQAEPPAPAVPAPAPPMVKREISLACPGYEKALAQMLEEAIERVGIVGTVRTRLTVRGNQVVEAVPVSGPREYHKYVQAAVRRMNCSAGGADEVQVSLDVNFSH